MSEQPDVRKLRSMRVAVAVIAAIVIVGGAVAYFWPDLMYMFKVYEIEGVVTHVDTRNNAISIEYTHPFDGHRQERQEQFPDDATFDLDGKQVGLDAIQVGDLVYAEVRINRRTKDVAIESARIARPESDEPGATGTQSAD